MDGWGRFPVRSSPHHVPLGERSTRVLEGRKWRTKQHISRQEIVNEMPPRSGGCEYSHLYCTSFAVVGREQVQMTGFNGSNGGSAACSPQSLAFPRRNASDLVDDDGDWAPDLTLALSRTWKSVRWVDESSCSRGHRLAPGFYRAARV